MRNRLLLLLDRRRGVLLMNTDRDPDYLACLAILAITLAAILL